MSNNLQNSLPTLVAILLVIVTLYFTTNALRRNQLKLEEADRLLEYEKGQQQLIRQELAEKEIQRQADISAKFKEHQHFCYDLQIFTSDIYEDEENEELLKQQQQQLLVTTKGQANQILLKQNKKTYRQKDLNKNQQQTKKGQSTEPIIYLFVLVFLYLLLKAASDITQHYKEQSKGDKRNNRRCSLQVYAQMKNERRSSKENRLLTMNSRSKSVDRPILQRSKRIYPKLRSYTSVDERSSCSNSTTVLAEVPAQTNVIPMNSVVSSLRPKSLIISETPSSRRCSVPALSLQQMGMLSQRRTSSGTLIENDPLGLEKKRHRMIQRH